MLLSHFDRKSNPAVSPTATEEERTLDRIPTHEEQKPTPQQRIMVPRCRAAAFTSARAVGPTTDTHPPHPDRLHEDFLEEMERWDGMS